MRLECGLYLKTLRSSHNKLLEKANVVGACQAATEFSCYSHVPLAAVIVYLLRPEVIGETVLLRDQLESVVKFNGYTEVAE